MGKDLFERQVLTGLKKCGVSLKGKCGAAVSGGADSISLLYALASLCHQSGVPLRVITVNHFIRPEKETCGDADFVIQQCRLLKEQGYDVEVTLHSLARGEVNTLAKEKGIGLEAAARLLRYQAFEAFIQKEHLDFLCLAHNKNDQTETLLMRFLQGSGGSASAGIPCVREKFVRPLLWTERAQIESYLKEKGLSWRTDSTNSDTKLLRNKIRLELIPFLNSHFKGWDNSVQNGFQKTQEDSDYADQAAKEVLLVQKSSDEIFIKAQDFYPLHRAVKTRVLLIAANRLGFDMRIPYVFLRDICDCADNYIEENAEKNKGKTASKEYEGFSVVLDKKGVLLKTTPRIQNEIVFSAIIDKGGSYTFPWGQVNVPEELNFPVLLRSWRSDDVVQTASGGTKKVNSVLSAWHVEETLRHYIPVVQALDDPEQKILCILGSCKGYKDWIVKK